MKTAVISRRCGKLSYKYTVAIFNETTTGYTQGSFRTLKDAIRCAMDRKPTKISIRNILKKDSSWHYIQIPMLPKEAAK